MAKIQLISETHAADRRNKPGFALLKISGWQYPAEMTQFSIQRSEDEKFLGTNGQWEPSPIWHILSNMKVMDVNVLEGDVGPALVDPIVNSPNNSYRVTLKSDEETETRTMRVDGDIFSSSASGSTPDSMTIGEGFILDDAPEEAMPDTDNEMLELSESDIEIEPDIPPVIPLNETIAPAEHPKSGANKLLIIPLVLIILALAAAALWYFKVPPFFAQQADSSSETTTADKSVSDASMTASGDIQTQLSDMALLQQFLATNPTTDEILLKAKEWKDTGHCKAMLKMMVYSGHKSNDSNIAMEYAKMHDPNLFQAGGCIENPDKDTSVYWYQKSIDAGNTKAKQYLEKL